MRVGVMVVALVFVAGCVSQSPIQSPYQALYDSRVEQAKNMSSSVTKAITAEGEEKLLDRVRQMVADAMKDPESTRFRNVRMVKYHDAIAVCGEVNSKNSMGGYVGYKPFIAGLNDFWVQSIENMATAAGAADSGGYRTHCLLGEPVKINMQH